MNPRDQTLVESAWPKIDAAVKAGMERLKDDLLAAIVAVPSRPSDLKSHVRFEWGSESGAGLKQRVLSVTVNRIHELRAIKPLSIGSLEPEFTSDERLVTWAEETRLREVRWAIEQVASQATRQESQLDVPALDAARAAIGADQEFMTSWRLVAFTPVEHLAEHCKTRNIEYVDATNFKWSTDAGVALLYPCDRFAISRLEEFALTWEFSDDDSGIVLALTERAELIGFTKEVQSDVRRFMTAGALPKP